MGHTNCLINKWVIPIEATLLLLNNSFVNVKNMVTVKRKCFKCNLKSPFGYFGVEENDSGAYSSKSDLFVFLLKLHNAYKKLTLCLKLQMERASNLCVFYI